jgi:hypothetical protein
MKKTLSLRSTKRFENELNLIRLQDRDTKVKFMLKILVYGGPLVS